MGVALSSVALLAMLFAAPPASAGRSDTITGFVGESPTMPAMGAVVTLVDPSTDEVIASATTNLFGKYNLRGVPIGTWRLRVGAVDRQVTVSGGTLRLDIDLSAADGTMDYGRAAVPQPPQSPPAAAAAPPSAAPPRTAAATPSSDPALMRQMAATYYQYSAGGLGYTGGTERIVSLCEDGRVFSTTDTSYSGGWNGDWATSGGNQSTGTWSVVGSWDRGTLTTFSQDGSPTVYPFSRCGNGCVYFGNTKFAISGPPSCP